MSVYKGFVSELFLYFPKFADYDSHKKLLIQIPWKNRSLSQHNSFLVKDITVMAMSQYEGSLSVLLSPFPKFVEYDSHEKKLLIQIPKKTEFFFAGQFHEYFFSFHVFTL